MRLGTLPGFFLSTLPSLASCPSLLAIAIVSPFVTGFLAMARIYPANPRPVKIFPFLVASCRLIV